MQASTAVKQPLSLEAERVPSNSVKNQKEQKTRRCGSEAIIEQKIPILSIDLHDSLSKLFTYKQIASLKKDAIQAIANVETDGQEKYNIVKNILKSANLIINEAKSLEINDKILTIRQDSTNRFFTESTAENAKLILGHESLKLEIDINLNISIRISLEDDRYDKLILNLIDTKSPETAETAETKYERTFKASLLILEPTIISDGSESKSDVAEPTAEFEIIDDPSSIKINKKAPQIKRSEGKEPIFTLLSCGYVKDRKLMIFNNRINNILAQPKETLNAAGLLLRDVITNPKTLNKIYINNWITTTKNGVEETKLENIDPHQNILDLLKRTDINLETIATDIDNKIKFALESTLLKSNYNSLVINDFSIWNTKNTEIPKGLIQPFELFLNKILTCAQIR